MRLIKMLGFLKAKFGNKQSNKFPFLSADGVATATFKYQSVKKIGNLLVPKEIDITHVSSKISEFLMDNLSCYRLYQSDNLFLQLNYQKNTTTFLDGLYMEHFKTLNIPDTETYKKYYKNIGSPSIELDDVKYARDVDDENEDVIEPFYISETFENGDVRTTYSMIYRDDLTGTDSINNEMIYAELHPIKLKFFKTHLIEFINI